MMSSVIPARLEYQCGHAALVSLPRIKGESSAQRNERVTREKSAAQTRACDFCGPTVEIVVVAAPPVAVVEPPPAVAAPVVEEPVVVPVAVAPTPAVNGHVVPEPVLTAEPAANGHIAPEPVVTAEPAANGHVVPEPAVAEEEPQPIVRVVTVRPKVARRPRVVTSTETAAPEPTPLVVIATRPRVVARKPRVQQPRPVKAAALRRFTISYQVEQVLTAADIRDALRQVASLGATNVIAITRQ